MKYSIFIYEGELDTADVRRSLMISAISSYCIENNIEFDGSNVTIKHDSYGKPYIEGHPVHFNVSHTGNMWMCMVGQAPCGLDIQQAAECNFERIARRHFSRDEQDYVRLWGIDGFFRIWTRREAYGKYTGRGFYGKMPPFVDSKGELQEYTGEAYLREIYIAEDIFCVYCTGGKNDEVEFFG